MSVYKEGYFIVDALISKQVQIFEDACDVGVPVRKGDKYWNMSKQLVDFYGDEGTRKVYTYTDGLSVEQDVTIMDEWAYSDGEKTEAEATDVFRVGFIPCKKGACKGFDGFIFIYEKK